MDDRKENFNIYTKDLIFENKSISYKIYNYFNYMLKDKKEINSFVLYVLYILETLQLISYGISEPHINTWKVNNLTIKNISNILGISRIIYIMKYFKFEIYLIIFFILVFF